ncbi:MAG TPA: hypothetical protein PKM39_07995, partial [Pseudothauera hydrothermalis]|nr:hypothetical protein [Pseudothauera hydrothermalis]
MKMVVPTLGRREATGAGKFGMAAGTTAEELDEGLWQRPVSFGNGHTALGRIPLMSFKQPIPTIRRDGDCAVILDQTLLPHRTELRHLSCLDEVAHAIRSMQVRGAPLIGATAAYGVSLALMEG